jgi:hypothetical protein
LILAILFGRGGCLVSGEEIGLPEKGRILLPECIQALEFEFLS